MIEDIHVQFITDLPNNPNQLQTKNQKPMKTEITLTIDPTDPQQVTAALALFQKLSGNAAPAAANVTNVTNATEAKPKAEKAKTAKAEKTAEPKEEAATTTAAETTETAAAATSTVEIKIEEVRAKLSEKVGTHREAIKSKLTALGAPNVSTLDPSKYAEFKTFLEGLA